MLVCALGLFGGGLVKGALGVGLPMVAVPVLSTVVPPATAIAMLSIPILATNLVQIRLTESFRPELTRFRLLFVMLVIGILIGASLLTVLSVRTIEMMIGVLLIGFVVGRAVQNRLRIPPAWEPRLSPCVGLGAGLVGGFSSFFGPPIIVYLMGLRLAKEDFVRTIALTYLIGLTPLYAMLVYIGAFRETELLWSCAAVVPAALGQAIGKRVRKTISQRVFEIALSAVMAFLGGKLILGTSL